MSVSVLKAGGTHSTMEISDPYCFIPNKLLYVLWLSETKQQNFSANLNTNNMKIYSDFCKIEVWSKVKVKIKFCLE